MTTTPFGIDWQDIGSQIIAQAAHDGQKSLYIAFQDGSSYVYDNVDPAVLDGLLGHDPDTAFLANVRDSYAFTRLSANVPRSPYGTHTRPPRGW